jgi:hypothetical protein
VVFASGVLGAGAMLIALFILGVRLPTMNGPEPAAGAPVGSATAAPSFALAECAVTLPSPAFSALTPYPSSPPNRDEAWFGTRDLWTKLKIGGEVWDASNTSFPVAIKTFWWSANWPGMRDVPVPAITVTATRLDGPGSVTTHDATNAAADDLGGEAMLVGIEFPAPGCWQLTAQYQDAVLSYVVLIAEE